MEKKFLNLEKKECYVLELNNTSYSPNISIIDITNGAIKKDKLKNYPNIFSNIKVENNHLFLFDNLVKAQILNYYESHYEFFLERENGLLKDFDKIPIMIGGCKKSYVIPKVDYFLNTKKDLGIFFKGKAYALIEKVYIENNKKIVLYSNYKENIITLEDNNNSIENFIFISREKSLNSIEDISLFKKNDKNELVLSDIVIENFNQPNIVLKDCSKEIKNIEDNFLESFMKTKTILKLENINI